MGLVCCGEEGGAAVGTKLLNLNATQTRVLWMQRYLHPDLPSRDSLESAMSCPIAAKMASHAIFQYNVLAIDDTHNTWTNMIVKMNIPRLLGSSDDKEEIGVARPDVARPESSSVQGTRIEAFCYYRLNRRRAK